MTQTTQPRTCATINEEGKDLTVNKSENDENVELLFSLCDSLNELHDKLCRLNHVIEKKIEEYNLFMESE